MSGFNFQKVSQFINRMQRELNQFRLFGKKLSNSYENTQQDITKVLECKKQISEKYKNKDKEAENQFKKDLNNIDYIKFQRELNQANILWMKNHMENWVEVNKQMPKSLLERAKKLESRRINKQLTSQQVDTFKGDLIKSVMEHRKTVQEFVKTLSQWNIKNCCALIEELTTRMYVMRLGEKKRESKTAPKVASKSFAKEGKEEKQKQTKEKQKSKSIQKQSKEASKTK